MKIMIVEDDLLLAESLQCLTELDARHWVVGIADDEEGALELAAATQPDLALVDIQLSSMSSGYAVSDALNRIGVPCIFSTATPPPFPLPELALGCLVKPYGVDELGTMLKAAEKTLTGDEAVPRNVQVYKGALELGDLAVEDITARRACLS